MRHLITFDADLYSGLLLRLKHHQFNFLILNKMKTLFILTVILFAVLSAKDADKGSECCPKKIVGGKTYIHIGEADKSEAMQFKCFNPCVYIMEGDENEKFCFKPGQLESKCVSGSTGMPDYSSTSSGPGGLTPPTTTGGVGVSVSGGLYPL